MKVEEIAKLNSKIILTSKLILENKIDFLKACRDLSLLLNERGIDMDQRFIFLKGFVSETEIYPSGTVRKEWEAKALAKMDKKLSIYIERIRNDIYEICRALIQYLS